MRTERTPVSPTAPPHPRDSTAAARAYYKARGIHVQFRPSNRELKARRIVLEELAKHLEGMGNIEGCHVYTRVHPESLLVELRVDAIYVRIHVDRDIKGAWFATLYSPPAIRLRSARLPRFRPTVESWGEPIATVPVKPAHLQQAAYLLWKEVCIASGQGWP
jgi:hypothetical protein